MKLVVFGLTVSSSWGNGHATLWRGLIRALGGARIGRAAQERVLGEHTAQRRAEQLLALLEDMPEREGEAVRA